MAVQYMRHASFYTMWCGLCFLIRCLSEILIALLRAPYEVLFHKTSSPPRLYFVENSFNKDVVSRCSSLAYFKELWWATGGHVQTFLMACMPPPKREYRRESIYLPRDGVHVSVDWLEGDSVTPESPIVLILHGLGGSSTASRSVQLLAGQVAIRGYRAAVYNRRGHGFNSLLPTKTEAAAGLAPSRGQRLKSALKERTMECQCAPIFPKHVNMEDMEAVVTHLQNLYPEANKYLIGLSCGANLAVQYIARAGSSSPFLATASVSNGYNIYEGSAILKKDPIVDGLATQMLRDILGEGRLPECIQLAREAGIQIDFDAVMSSRSLQDFESLIVLPAYGYSSLEEYYDEVSCHYNIQRVVSPLLCICCEQDPMVHTSMTEIPIAAAQTNENILTVVTKGGGHIGWFDDEAFNGGVGQWYIRLFMEYIHTITELHKEKKKLDSQVRSRGRSQSRSRLRRSSSSHKDVGEAPVSQVRTKKVRVRKGRSKSRG
ncbi:hypothetical protein CEUSTIGMA_g8570.t1 [Chlamydomonas eustigma]|uniref:AB hydrolase-1 domain-containing protein n=1 Tax=Chlamydomonas eustigma TaxID=1157962 RepID=A0A250XDJ8_9CHLO|nr:hypothetical protein CEUSTIGMA_g8570.t1 [Chlamydomonas eustigma]|eukprot:GAX81136.1 hypothetical protein CEUSTIGMA_g8570.t1 [Chlamydomonas eustigma]